MTIRLPLVLATLFLAGCELLQPLPEEPATRQVASSPFTEPRRSVAQASIALPPASQETAVRVELLRGQLIGKNEQIGLRPHMIALGSPDPEIFHLGMNTIYITEGLVRQLPTEGNLAAALANELGRMVSERESAVSDEVRKPERPRPIKLPIGSNGYADDADPNYLTMLGRYEKSFPKQHRKLAPPNPQLVARTVLERTGFQTTELDAILPTLQNAARFSLLENQVKGTLKPSDWKAP